MKSTIRRRLTRNLLVIAIITIPLSLFFWKWFDRPYNWGEYYLELDYFNTVCGIFTILGLLIALYQIAQLKSEQEIVEVTIARTQAQIFREDTLNRFESLRTELIDFQRDIGFQVYSSSTIKSYIKDLNRFKHLIQDTHIRQGTLTNTALIPCKDCVPLLQDLIDECLRVVNTKLWGSLRRSLFFTHLKQILAIIADCEAKLKS